MDSYDLVISLTTAAKGAQKYYTTSNNSARKEDIKEAIIRDDKVQDAWSFHNNLKIVSNKYSFDEKVNNVLEIIKKLHAEGVSFISTGGTKSFIESLGLPCEAVEDLTGFPSILGGRVKTLHPNIFGGILARRENETDQTQLAQYNIPEIDLVIVDLYPFRETVASGAEEQAIIEKIDIGGISLIRAAAKNFKDVVIVASKDQYSPLFQLLEEKGAETTIVDRKWFAKEAFAVSSGYDSAIFNYFDDRDGSVLRVAVDEKICVMERIHTRMLISMASLKLCSIRYTEKKYHTIIYWISMLR